MKEIRPAKIGEFDELMRLLENCFNKSMADDYCHIYRKTPNHTAMNKIIKLNEKIASNVGVFPLSAVTNGIELSIAGVGGIATDPKYRGKGLMAELLSFSIKHMKDNQYDISVLDGDRWRYGNYGWERGGRCYCFSINKSSIRDLKPYGYAIKPYSRSNLKQVINIHEKEPMRAKRTEDDYRLIFKRRKIRTFLAQNNSLISYICLVDNNVVVEFGGDYKGLSDLILFCFRKLDIKELTIKAPYVAGKNIQLLFKLSASWYLHPSCMIKILKIRSLLNKYLSLINKRYAEFVHRLNGELTLKSSDSGEYVSIIYGDNITLSNKITRNVLTLSDRELVILLFGIVKPGMILNLGIYRDFFNRIFPLDFYIWSSEFV